MKRIVVTLILFSFFMLSSCVGSTYYYNLKGYQTKSAAYSAQDAFLSDLEKNIGEPLSEPLSNKKLLIGIPNYQAFEKMFIVKGQVNKDSKDYVTTANEKDYLTMGKWVKNKNIYKESELIRTNGEHLQPSENTDVLYLYLEPPASLSWYIADQKYGRQTMAPDSGISDLVEKNRNWLQSIQAFAIRE